MTRHPWSGRWPTDEYPADGTRLRYEVRAGVTKTARIVWRWCGEEPCLVMDNGFTIFPSLDRYEVLEEIGTADGCSRPLVPDHA